MATFRLRKPGGGSAIRGGDGLRGPDKSVFEYTASGGIVFGGTALVAKTKLFIADGGIELGGAADVAKVKHFAAVGGIEFGGSADSQYVDGRGYVGSGGIVYGGSADSEFVSAQIPVDHGGGGSYHRPRAPGVPILRRQFGHAVTFEFIAEGGILYSGKADTAYARHSVTHEAPAATGGIVHGGESETIFHSAEDDQLALMAA